MTFIVGFGIGLVLGILIAGLLHASVDYDVRDALEDFNQRLSLVEEEVCKLKHRGVVDEQV